MLIFFQANIFHAFQAKDQYCMLISGKVEILVDFLHLRSSA